MSICQSCGCKVHDGPCKIEDRVYHAVTRAKSRSRTGEKVVLYLGRNEWDELQASCYGRMVSIGKMMKRENGSVGEILGVDIFLVTAHNHLNAAVVI